MFNSNRDGIRVTKFILHETGTYNMQYRRPYDTSFDGSISSIFQERLHSANKITAANVAGIAGHFIKPMAAPETGINIINGWNQRRMRFSMEIKSIYPGVGAEITEMILGYTDYDGVTVSGSIDPKMIFFINSVVMTRNLKENTPFGSQTYSTVIDNSHVLVDNTWSGISQQAPNHRMRPEDLYATMGSALLPDMQIIDQRTLLDNRAVKSRRGNGIASNYMAEIIQNMRNAEADEAFGEGGIDTLEKARGFSAEKPAASDTFISAIANIRNIPPGNMFTFGDLQMLDRNVDNIAIVVVMAPTERSMMHQSETTSPWGGSDLYTQTATILSQSIPGLLMEQGLTMIVFKSTNLDRAGTITTAVFDVNGFSNAVNQASDVQNFILNLEHQILRDISFDGNISFAIEMRVDLLGETWINLSLDGKEMVEFVTPSFCDAMTVPVITSNNQLARNVASDFDSLLRDIKPMNCQSDPGFFNNVNSNAFGIL